MWGFAENHKIIINIIMYFYLYERIYFRFFFFYHAFKTFTTIIIIMTIRLINQWAGIINTRICKRDTDSASFVFVKKKL